MKTKQIINATIFLTGFLFILIINKTYTQTDLKVFYPGENLDISDLAYTKKTSVNTPCGLGERISIIGINGKKVSEVEWYNGYRCGITKIYNDGFLIKEIKFYYDLILSYTSYENGVIKDQITENRLSFKRNGVTISDKWQSISINIGNRKVVVLSKKEFVDLCSMIMMPEEILDYLAGINDAAGQSVATGNKNLFACGGDMKAIPGSDLKAGLKSNNPQKKSEAFEIIKSSLNQCSANLSNFNKSSYNGISSGPSAEQARIGAASSAIDNLIAKCEANKDDNSMIADPEDEAWGLVRRPDFVRGVVRDVANEKTLVVARATIAAASTSKDIAAVIRAVPPTSKPGVFILLGTFAAGVGVGTVINYIATQVGFADAVVDFAVEVKDKVEAQAASNPVSENNSNNPPSDDSKAKLLLPGGGDDCQRLKNFKDRCDRNGWNTMDCQDFARIFSNCGGNVDPREVNVNPDNEFAGGNCADLSALDKQKLKCKNMGMIALFPPGGEMVCAQNKSFGVDLLSYNPKNSWWTDPVRPFENTFTRTNFKSLFSKSKIISYDKLTLKEFKNLSANRTKTTLFVFLDADCPACKSFVSTLTAKEIGDAMNKGFDIVAIDAGANPELYYNLNIYGYPSFFLKKSNGSVTPMVIGTQTVSDLLKFINTP